MGFKLQMGHVALENWRVLYTTLNMIMFPRSKVLYFPVGDVMCTCWKDQACCNSFPFQHHDTCHTDVRLKCIGQM